MSYEPDLLADGSPRTGSITAMFLMLRLTEEATEATDYDETLLPIAIGFLVVTLLYAAIATWIVTPLSAHH